MAVRKKPKSTISRPPKPTATKPKFEVGKIETTVFPSPVGGGNIKPVIHQRDDSFQNIGKPLESGWVIEKKGSPEHAPIYWCAGIWATNDSVIATRFSRQIDAVRVTDILLRNTGHRISFHEWA